MPSFSMAYAPECQPGTLAVEKQNGGFDGDEPSHTRALAGMVVGRGFCNSNRVVAVGARPTTRLGEQPSG
jgi:hypothetical protein